MLEPAQVSTPVLSDVLPLVTGLGHNSLANLTCGEEGFLPADIAIVLVPVVLGPSMPLQLFPYGLVLLNLSSLLFQVS